MDLIFISLIFDFMIEFCKFVVGVSLICLIFLIGMYVKKIIMYVDYYKIEY